MKVEYQVILLGMATYEYKGQTYKLTDNECNGIEVSCSLLLWWYKRIGFKPRGNKKIGLK